MVDDTLLSLPLPESRHKRTKLLYGIQFCETVYFICKKLENLRFLVFISAEQAKYKMWECQMQMSSGKNS